MNFRVAEKIAVVERKQVSFTGHFDLKKTYTYLIEYLENSRHFDISVVDYVETNDGKEKEIEAKIICELYYTDYYKVIITFKISLSGIEKEFHIQNSTQILCDGTAKLFINSYIEPDFLNRNFSGGLSTLFRKVYDRYIGKSELDEAMRQNVEEVSALVGEFKKLVQTTF